MTKDPNQVLFKLHWNWASEADIQHASKSSSDWHVNQDWFETSGTFFLEMTKDRSFTYLGPKNWTSETHILHTSKSTCNEHVKQRWCEFFFEKVTKVLTYLGAQRAKKIRPLRPIFSTHLKVLVMSMWSNADVKIILRKWPKSRVFTKMAPKLGPYCTHLWK